MPMPTIIYCGNTTGFSEIALEYGFEIGFQLPGVVRHTPFYFADQNWKKPNRESYIAAIKKYKPQLATVIDWERSDQFDDVVGWAEEIAPHVESIIIIPKVHGGIDRIPDFISGKPIRLGYSVPTAYGGTELPIWEFSRRPVHLLGGNPGSQMRLSHYMNVVSVDGNMHQKMANQKCAFWRKGMSPFSNDWLSLLEVDKERFKDHGPSEAFRRSCESIMTAWKNMYKFR